MSAAPLLGFNFIFLMAALLIGGIILLILGLTKKMKVLWGIAIGLLALCILLLAFVGYFYFRNIRLSEEYAYDDPAAYPYVQPTDPTAPVTYSPYADSVLRTNFESSTFCLAQDQQGVVQRVEIFAHKFMAKKGLNLVSVDIAQLADLRTEISVKIASQQAYSGKIMLEVYGADERVLASIARPLSVQKSAEGELNIQLPSNINISDLRYCTLTAFE